MSDATTKDSASPAATSKVARRTFGRAVKRRLSKGWEPVSNRYRLLTARMRVLPDFLIIGAQKAGTSSLYGYLVQHPDAMECADKEPNYFFRHYDKGLDWYRSRFPLSLAARARRRATGYDVLTGEATVSYLSSPDVPRRVFDVLPQVKLIVLLRDPVDRAYSHYNHRRRKGNEPRSFEEAVESDKRNLKDGWESLKKDGSIQTVGEMHFSYLARGFYVDQLKLWMSVFPREQFLIVKAEDFYSDPRVVFKKTLRFLDLRDWDLPSYRRFNVGGYTAKISPSTRDDLNAYFAPHNRRLYEYLGTDFGWGSA
jgi:hypothetical protein